MTAFDVATDGQKKPSLEPPSSGGTCIPAATSAAPAPLPSSPSPSPLASDSSPAAPAASPLIGSPEPPTRYAQPIREFSQSAIAGAGIPIVGLDCFGHICLWNHTAARLFGRTEAEVLGRPMDMLIPSEYRALAFRAFQRTLQQRSVNMYEMAFVPPGGKHPLHLGVTLSCVLGPSGEPSGVVAWLRDITNRKELETNLLRTRHMASLGTLAAGVAHHFNNIVCGMHTMVELALSTEDPAAMKRALRMSAEAASRIGYITQSLLAFSSEEGGDPDLVDLTEELLRFADAVEPTLRQKDIQLVLDLQAHRVATVPRHRFGQVLHHLLRNAEEAFADVPAGRPRQITIRTRSQDEQLMLQFADTGAGIPPENLPLVFDPFFTTKGVQNGGHQNNPGLGLTLVHGVVMDLGGHVWADSVVGQGTTLNILIPIVV